MDSFNPRARAGRDIDGQPWVKDPLFQSTRPRGARLESRCNRTLTRVSIHAPARGATVIFEPRKNHAVSDMILRTYLFMYRKPPSNVSISA